MKRENLKNQLLELSNYFIELDIPKFIEENCFKIYSSFWGKCDTKSYWLKYIFELEVSQPNYWLGNLDIFQPKAQLFFFMLNHYFYNNNKKNFNDLLFAMLKGFVESDNFINIAKLKSHIPESFIDNNFIDKLSNIQTKSKIFIVHGRDESTKNNVADFIQELGFSPTILSREANKGDTIYEKLLEHAKKSDYAIVIYTPCDEGKLKTDVDLNDRARQNVVFEHGLLVGILGREKVCAIVKGDIETPSDIQGVVYENYDNQDNWKNSLIKELKIAGFNL